MEEVISLYKKHIYSKCYFFIGIWLIGLVGLGFGANRLARQIQSRVTMESALQEFKLSLDNINEAVMMFETNNLELFYANRGAQKMVGLGGQQVQWLSLPELVSEQERPHLYELLGQFYKRQQDSYTGETVFVGGSGNHVPVEVHIAYVVPVEGADRFLVVARDISKRITVENEKQAMQTRLLQAQKLESVGQLAAGIAHEINTPAQIVSANMEFFEESFTDMKKAVDRANTREAKNGDRQIFADFLEEADWEYLEEEVPQAFRQSREALYRISKIVTAMKEFASPGRRQKTEEDLNDIVETTITVTRNEWKYVAELTTDLDENLPPVLCLRDELGQVLLNLITNAAYAIEERMNNGDLEGEKGLIRIKTRVQDDFAELVVHDNGAGIAEEIRHRIFDPFFSTKEVGKGAGQGLAICRDVIEKKHDGQLLCSTSDGKGTTFTIRLPLKAG